MNSFGPIRITTLTVLLYESEIKQDNETIAIRTESKPVSMDLIAPLSASILLSILNRLHPLSEQQATNRLCNGCTRGAEGLPQHV